jgi:hypothetical protein
VLVLIIIGGVLGSRRRDKHWQDYFHKFYLLRSGWVRYWQYYQQGIKRTKLAQWLSIDGSFQGSYLTKVSVRNWRDYVTIITQLLLGSLHR